MEEKINIDKILKDKPEKTILYDAMRDINVSLYVVEKRNGETNIFCDGGGEDSEMSKLCHTLWMPPKEYDKEQHCICNRYDTTSCNFTEMDMSKVFILAKNGRYIPFEEALKMRERINV